LFSIFFIDSNTGWTVGGAGTILKTTNNGVTWIIQKSGVQSELYSVFFLDSNIGWIAGFNGVIFKTTNGGVTFIEDEYHSSQPNSFYLSQNFPNPFNPSTSLQYAIGRRQFITLKDFDLLGREVATLINEEKPAGEYEVEFDGSALTSGIYFYQLKAGQYSETKKMILLK
jgi:hypothetical protein